MYERDEIQEAENILSAFEKKLVQSRAAGQDCVGIPVEVAEQLVELARAELLSRLMSRGPKIPA